MLGGSIPGPSQQDACKTTLTKSCFHLITKSDQTTDHGSGLFQPQPSDTFRSEWASVLIAVHGAMPSAETWGWDAI